MCQLWKKIQYAKKNPNKTKKQSSPYNILFQRDLNFLDFYVMDNFRTKNKGIFRGYFIRNLNENLTMASSNFILYFPIFEDIYLKWTISSE